MIKIILIIIAILVILGFLLYKQFQNPVITMKDLHTYKTNNLRRLVPKEFDFTTHKVTTEDGYILQLINIRHKENYKEEYNPVLIQHGNTSSCSYFLTNDPHLCPPLILAKLG